jgi:hypothetical protein
MTNSLANSPQTLITKWIANLASAQVKHTCFWTEKITLAKVNALLLVASAMNPLLSPSDEHLPVI